jgi:hypothetical protein
MIARACAIGLVLATAGCSLGDEQESAASKPELASGQPLPARCVDRDVRRQATVTFVANGRAWALEPRSRRLTCLFGVRDPGPFAWGPRADRAQLARLEVKAFGDAPTQPPTTLDPAVSSWGRPTGKSIVFVARDGRALLKAHPAGGGITDVTPIRGVRYKRVVYHPSGLAFAFVVKRGRFESVWISSNRGEKPQQLVHGRAHTGFGALAFSENGTRLHFAARHFDGHVDVHWYWLAGADTAPVEWRGPPGEHVSDLSANDNSGLALTVGRSCESRRAVAVTDDEKGADLLPGKSPTRALGWLDDGHVLVARGGCGEKLDLFSVPVRSRDARLLVRGVDTASVRRTERFPPPPLPAEVGPEQRTPA